MLSFLVNPMSESVDPALVFGLPKLPVTLPVVLNLGLILERLVECNETDDVMFRKKDRGEIHPKLDLCQTLLETW